MEKCIKPNAFGNALGSSLAARSSGVENISSRTKGISGFTDAQIQAAIDSSPRYASLGNRSSAIDDMLYGPSTMSDAEDNSRPQQFTPLVDANGKTISFMEASQQAVKNTQTVTVSLADEINAKVKTIRQIDQTLSNDYDESGLWHNVKGWFNLAKPLAPAELIEQRTKLLSDVSESYAYLRISGASPMDQAYAASTFAYLPKGITYNESNVGNIMKQLSASLARPDLSEADKNVLQGALNDVYQRGNSEGVLDAKLNKHVIAYNLGAALMTEQTGRPSIHITTSRPTFTQSPFVPYKNYTQRTNSGYGASAYTDAKGNVLTSGVPNTANLTTGGVGLKTNAVEDFSPIPESYMKPDVTIDMRTAPASSGTNAAGFPRNGPWFWRQMAETNPEYFDTANLARIRAGRSPVVNDTWVENFPEHQGFLGDKLVHHHIDQGPIATPLPEIIHQKWYKALHPNQ